MKQHVATRFLGVFTLLLLCSISAEAQFFKKLKERVAQRAEETVTRKIEEKTEEKTEQAIDSVFEIGSGKKRRQQDSTDDMEMGEMDEMSSAEEEMTEEAPTEAPPSYEFKVYSKYDFIPGEELMAFEDFTQDEIGDLPARWNTNTSAEVVTLSNQEGHWMKVGKGKSAYVAEFIEEVPENFTLEFDVIFDFDPEEWAYSRTVGFLLSDLENPNYRLDDWQAGKNLFRMNLHFPKGTEYYKRASDSQLNTDANKSIAKLTREGFQAGEKIHVAIWRQKTRVRVYVEDQKVFDVPRALEKGVVANTLRLQSHISEEGHNAYISNIRYAVGKPDMRSKLITEGRLVTYGITFDTGSAYIKSESTGTLKKIADILKANPSLQVQIVGHTDADGDANYNMDLSMMRASSVEQVLVDQFGVDASQLSSTGKGESELLDPGTSSESKARNRRVEFIKQ